jgi:acyl-lipid omega-6 desaturase (Delta-12 desaturase)
MTTLEALQRRKLAVIRAYSKSSDAIGLIQSATTLVPLAVLCFAAAWGLQHDLRATVAAAVGITLLLLRVFSLMHECGHGALFASRSLNRGFGFLFGVISGMPQYVWSQHHEYHHRHNGNWEKYRGPLSTLSTHEYAALSPAQQKRYRRMRHLAFAPLAGFVYLIFNPRVNWFKGNLSLLLRVVQGCSLAQFQTRYWKTWREYRHMTANNIVLISAWVALSSLIGIGSFFAIYLSTLSVAGGVAILLFTVQHNFDQSYAATTATWSYDRGALHGTSFLVLPGWMNWCTANIGYHHVHHLSSSIPNYRLVECHRANADMFVDVPRITLAQVPAAVSCILWDTDSERIISFSEYERAAGALRA